MKRLVSRFLLLFLRFNAFSCTRVLVSKNRPTQLSSTKKVTLMDIAKRAKCSTATVSTVLNAARGNTRLSSATQKRILDIAHSLNYRPHHAAQALASRRSKTLGLYVAPRPWGTVGNSHYEGRLLRGIEKACRARQYRLLLINLHGEESPDACMREVREQRVDGMILIQAGAIEDFTRQLVTVLPSVVMIDAICPHSSALSVLFDNHAAMDLAVEHLAQLGHSRIAFIGSCIEKPLPDAIQRREGFVLALQKRGMTLRNEWVFDAETAGTTLDSDCEFCQEEGDRAVRRFFAGDRSDWPTAIVAYNDLVSAGAVSRLCEMGVSIPQDVSVVGVDDSDIARILRPSLSSVRQPLEEMGFRAAEVLITNLETTKEPDNGDPNHDNVIAFNPVVVARQSSGPC